MTSNQAARLHRDLVRGWLGRRLGEDPLGWIDAQTARITAAPDARVLTQAIGLASRKVGKQPLALDGPETVAAHQLRPGIDVRGWTIDQVTRILLVLASYDGGEETFPARLGNLVRSGEIGEQLALLRGLPLYPDPQRLLPIAAEGIRSAMRPIFEAVAHASPYPAEQFSEAMWNQMVVKALFIDSTLAPIQDLDHRRNADLARMLVDYAHERWAAARAVSPELWRCVGPFAGDAYLEELVRVFASPALIERQAAALALAECPTPKALVILEGAPALWGDIRHGRLTWDTLA